MIHFETLFGKKIVSQEINHIKTMNVIKLLRRNHAGRKHGSEIVIQFQISQKTNQKVELTSNMIIK